MDDLALAHGLRFEDLYNPAGLARLDALFLTDLGAGDPALLGRLLAGRAAPKSLDDKAQSQLILDLAGHLEDFLGTLFGIGPELGALQAQHNDLAPLYTCKRLFVQRRALKAYGPDKIATIDANAVRRDLTALFGGTFDEVLFARHVEDWGKDEAAHA
ncbi:MAG: pyridine nucleotide-disulfide oxidoreductase, partial [Rhodospirillaceae bacterium]|nr:pyridine nucleotide-disulfide oxidoreductase [Rhodospirillaceae bacterium]